MFNNYLINYKVDSLTDTTKIVVMDVKLLSNEDCQKKADALSDMARWIMLPKWLESGIWLDAGGKSVVAYDKDTNQLIPKDTKHCYQHELTVLLEKRMVKERGDSISVPRTHQNKAGITAGTDQIN